MFLFSRACPALNKLVLPPSTSQASSGSAERQAAPNCNSDTPYEHRTCAKIGGFVFDSDRELLVTEAKRCLEAAEVENSTWKWMHSPLNKGSWVLLTFETPAALQKAKQAMNAANYSHGGRRIWLDAAKTQAELRPARITHRCYTALLAEEQKKEAAETLPVEKDLKGKQVKLGGKVAAYSYKGELCWTSLASTRYGSEVCHMVKAWVESS